MLKFPPRSLERTAEGGLHFKLSSEPGQGLKVQPSSDLDTWPKLGTVTNLTGSAKFTDRSPESDRRLYRLKLKP